MGKKQKKIARFLGQDKKESSDAPPVKYFQSDLIKLPWYFDGWFQKLLVVASFLALLWTILTIIVGGVCWR